MCTAVSSPHSQTCCGETALPQESKLSPVTVTATFYPIKLTLNYATIERI